MSSQVDINARLAAVCAEAEQNLRAIIFDAARAAVPAGQTSIDVAVGELVGSVDVAAGGITVGGAHTADLSLLAGIGRSLAQAVLPPTPPTFLGGLERIAENLAVDALTNTPVDASATFSTPAP